MRRFFYDMKIAEKLNIPIDIADGSTILTITGKREVFIENYKGVIFYEKNCIKVQTKQGRIIFCGKNLQIDYYTATDMKITGELNGISWS